MKVVRARMWPGTRNVGPERGGWERPTWPIGHLGRVAQNYDSSAWNYDRSAWNYDQSVQKQNKCIVNFNNFAENCDKQVGDWAIVRR